MVLQSALTSGIVLNCKFKQSGQRPYACQSFGNLITTESNRTVTKVIGTHDEGKSNDDVKEVLIYESNCTYLPLGIGKFFKNIELYVVDRSNVTYLTKGDLDGFDKLKTLSLSYNVFNRIPKGFFDGRSNITSVSMTDGKLKFAEPDVFDPLVTLKAGLFRNNPCIDFSAFHAGRVPMLKTLIKKCQ